MDISSMVKQVLNLAGAINTKVAGLPLPGTDLANAIASAQAAASSATSTGTQQTAAAASKTTAASEATAASTSATNAAGSATTAAGSASTASTQATAASGSASAASGSAGTATSSNTNAQAANNRAQTMQQVNPIQASTWCNGTTSPGSWSASASFTAPCNGWVFAHSSLNMSGQSSTNWNSSLSIDGSQMANDSTSVTQRFLGVLYVAAGTAVTVTHATNVGANTGIAATIHVTAFFVPATV